MESLAVVVWEGVKVQAVGGRQKMAGSLSQRKKEWSSDQGSSWQWVTDTTWMAEFTFCNGNDDKRNLPNKFKPLLFAPAWT